VKLIKFLDVVLTTFVVYLPLLIGKSKKNEESLFWASLITSLLAIISLLVMKGSHLSLEKVQFLPILISFIFGFGSYALYRMNWKIEKSNISPLTWLVLLPFIDTMILREFGIQELSWMHEIHQLLWWFVSLKVFVLAILAGLIYFFIFFRNKLFSATWEGGIAFTSSLVMGYVFVHYGLLNALLAEIAFNFWRIIFATKES
jgi:hypothetical protein